MMNEVDFHLSTHFSNFEPFPDRFSVPSGRVQTRVSEIMGESNSHLLTIAHDHLSVS